MAGSATLIALSVLLLLAGVSADSWAGKCISKESTVKSSKFDACELVREFYVKRLAKVLQVSAAIDDYILGYLSNSTVAPFYRVQAVLLAATYRDKVADQVCAGAIVASNHCVSVDRPMAEGHDSKVGDMSGDQPDGDVEDPFSWELLKTMVESSIRSNDAIRGHRVTSIQEEDGDDKELV